MNNAVKISLVTTVFNDEIRIIRFIDNILAQTILPCELIVVDGGSKDRTVEILKSLNIPFLRVLTNGRMNIAQGLNYGIERSKHDLIAICLVGVKYDNTWLEKLTFPIINGSADISSTFYGLEKNSYFAEAYAVFILMKNRSTSNFLPSSRSIAYLKEVWSVVGGYYEKFTYAGEDTLFTQKVKLFNFRIKIIEEELCHWMLPSDFKSIMKHRKYYIIADFEIENNNNYYIKKTFVLFSLMTTFTIGLIFNKIFVFVLFAILFFIFPSRKLFQIRNWKIIIRFFVLYYGFLLLEMRLLFFQSHKKYLSIF